MGTEPKTSKPSKPMSQSEKVKLNKALMALAKLSPEKRAEVVKTVAKKRGLI